MPSTSAELYLYMDVVKVLIESTCMTYDDGLDEPEFNKGLVGPMIILWIVCGLMLIKGVKSFQIVASALVSVSFILLFVLMAMYIGLNNNPGVTTKNEAGVDEKLPGKGMSFYGGGEEFAGAKDDSYLTFSNLFIDAFNMVFFSLGICVGVMYSFSSYNQIRKPVIMDTFIIAILDFLFSFMSGFIAWGAIGYLFAKKDPAFTETKSVALAFVALPSAASAGGGTTMLILFYITLFFAGITSAAGYVEAFACNIID